MSWLAAFGFSTGFVSIFLAALAIYVFIADNIFEKREKKREKQFQEELEQQARLYINSRHIQEQTDSYIQDAA
jgi:hypothetical protein